MHTTLRRLTLLTSAPIVLMPATLALFTKSDRVVPISLFNMLVWGGTYLNLMRATSMSSLPAPSMLLLLIAWLVLLRFAILPKKATGE